MVDDDEAQRHLDLSREYLAVAKAAAVGGNMAPARFNSVHALELAIKASLVGVLGAVPRTHNIGGEFGKHFRDRVGDEVARRVNRILHDYDGPRYPDWDPPEEQVVRDDLTFIASFVSSTVPKLLRGGRG